MSSKRIYQFDNESSSVYNRIHEFLSERYEIYFNEVSISYEIKLRETESSLEELNENSLLVILDQANIKTNRDRIITYLKSDMINRYNPIKRYFDNLPIWNGLDYIKQYCSYARTDDDDLYYYHLKKWAVRAIKSAVLENEINKHAVILANGDQNAGKSTYLKRLCPDSLERYYGENLTLDKDGRIKLCKSFIINLEELQGLNRQDTDKVKALIYLQTVNDRLPFDKKNSFMHRTCSFVGSTNKSEFLIDETGNVRWIVFELFGTIDYETYNKEFSVDNFWSQAFYIFQNEPDFVSHLTYNDVKQNEERNEKFMALSVECEAVLKFYTQSEDMVDFRTASEVVSELSLTGIKFSSNKLGSAFKKYGFTRTKHPQRQIYGYLAKSKFIDPPIKF